MKYMYRASTGHKFLLVVADEVTKYSVTIYLFRGASHKVGEAIINMHFANMTH